MVNTKSRRDLRSKKKMTAAARLGSDSVSTMNTAENNTVTTEINDFEQDNSKKKEEEELEKLAMNEILIETKRRAETAREFGALGWQKSPLLPVNKQFLKNTLVSTLRSAPAIKKEKKFQEQKMWKNSDYKSSFRRRSFENDVDSSRSKYRDSSPKLDERDKNKDSRRRSRLAQTSNGRHSHSCHSGKRSDRKTRDSGGSKSSNIHPYKNEPKSETDVAQTEQQGTNLIDNSSEENGQLKSETKTESLALNVKEKDTRDDDDVKLKEQGLLNESEHKDHKLHSRSLKRKRSKSHGENTTSSKKRKHRSRHKKDNDKKHKSKRKSKKHKKKDSEA